MHIICSSVIFSLILLPQQYVVKKCLFLIGIVTTELPRGSAKDAVKTELGADRSTWYPGWSAMVPIRA